MNSKETPYNLRDSTQILKDRLLGRKITCAGCMYRVLTRLPNKGLTQHCLKKQKLPDPLPFSCLTTGASEKYQTICSSFKGVPTKEIYREGSTYLLYERYYDDVHNNRVWILILDTPQKHELIEQFKKENPAV